MAIWWALTLNLTLAFSCARPIANRSAASNKTVAPTVVGTYFATVTFSEGKSVLNSQDKEFLKTLALRAHKENKSIKTIKILAWSDKEYPERKKSKASIQDIILASERAQKIRDYLEVNLKTQQNIDSFNMAKRPHLISKLFRDDDYELKEAFAASDVTSARLPDGSISYTKASKAIVVLDYGKTRIKK